MFVNSNGNLIHASKSTPCPHCGKPDWCYFIGELSVCKRGNPPAMGWQSTGKTDKDNSPYYAPISEKKSPREKQVRFWEYPARDGSPLVRVRREDDGLGSKKITQQHWDASEQTWKSGLGGVTRDQIPIYKYQEIQAAIFQGQTIFICEGEPCADALRSLGLAATTNIGGSGKFLASDASDLSGASIILCPDRDKPGQKHADNISKFFPDALWLYAFPESNQWENLPESGGLDIADWIADYRLGAEEILAAVGEKRGGKEADSPLKLEVKRYLSETDPFKQIQLKAEVCSHYRISKQDFDALAATLTQSQVSQPAKCYTGEEFLFLESEGLEWIYPGLIPAKGLTLIYSLPGQGKTTVGMDAIASYLLGEEFLGEKPNNSGPALIVSSDELPTYTQDKAITRGFPINRQWQVLTDWDVSQWGVLERKLEDFRPKFILIDSLTSIHFCDPNFDENSSKAAKSIKRLEILCQKYSCAILLIHHSNKDAGKAGVAMARGTTALTGAASTCISISPTGGDDTIKWLKVDKIRGARTRKLKIQLDGETGRWDVLEGKEETEELDLTLTERIANLLKSQSRLEISEICASVGLSDEKSNRDSVRIILTRLRDKGLCDRRPSRKNLKSHVWYWKANNDPVSEVVSIVVSIAQTHTQTELQPIDANNFDREGGGSPPLAKIETPPPPPSFKKVVSIKPPEPMTCKGYSNANNNANSPRNDANNPDSEFSEEDVSETVDYLENCDQDGLEILRGSIPKNLLHLSAARLPKSRQAELKKWIEEKNLAERLSEIAKWEPPSALRKFLSEHPLEKILAANQRLERSEPDVAEIVKVMAGKLAGVPDEKLSTEPAQLALEIDVPRQDDGWTQRGH